MTIKITDRTTGETYEAKTVEGCRDDWTHRILFRKAEADGRTAESKYVIAEVVGGYHGRDHCSEN
jgi:hypothetical protein